MIKEVERDLENIITVSGDSYYKLLADIENYVDDCIKKNRAPEIIVALEEMLAMYSVLYNKTNDQLDIAENYIAKYSEK